MKRLVNINDEVLVKYLLNEATGTEREAVQQWLQHAANKSYFDSLRLLWKNSRANVVSTVNVDDAWERFRARTKQPRKNIPMRPVYWLRAAAVLLLLAGGAWIVSQMLPTKEYSVASKQGTYSPLTDSLHTVMSSTPSVEAVKPNNITPPVVVISKQKLKQTALVSTKKIRKQFNQPVPYAKTDKFICNSTPCPVEICITQTLTCKSKEPSKTSSCSMIEPEQSGQVQYNAFKKIPKNCSASVEEITIKRITTGETIVLNADSKPATATDVFNYLTGEKKGDIIAGIFHTDCDNNSSTQGLKLDNSYGSLILQ